MVASDSEPQGAGITPEPLESVGKTSARRLRPARVGNGTEIAGHPCKDLRVGHTRVIYHSLNALIGTCARASSTSTRLWVGRR